MEQHQDHAAASSSKYRKMTKKQFEDLITVNRNDRYEVIYFISNTLNFILNGSSWYCYGEKIKIEKDGVVSTPRLHSGHCQSCRIPELFPDLERDIDV